eukprot:597775_1
MPPLVRYTCLSYFWVEPVPFLIQRVYVHSNNNLAWYPQPEKAKTQKDNPIGEISLYHATYLNKKRKRDDKGRAKYKFELVTHKRTFALKAEDANTYHSWIRHITPRVAPTVIYQSWGIKKGHKSRHCTKRYFVLHPIECMFYRIKHWI